MVSEVWVLINSPFVPGLTPEAGPAVTVAQGLVPIPDHIPDHVHVAPVQEGGGDHQGTVVCLSRGQPCYL